ncbi:hypothetical protein GF389_05330 [Candidatus Dojkabacteria bacterium]|nr:hypothetical protein [Candidatus Dojkabacteria bacterium]
MKKLYKSILFSLIFISGFGVVNAFDIQLNKNQTQENFSTVELSFKSPEKEVNSVEVHMAAEGMIIQNIQIAEDDQYLLIPTCSNQKIFASDEVCFSLGGEQSFEDGDLFATIDLEIVDSTIARLVKLENNAYSDGYQIYPDEGFFNVEVGDASPMRKETETQKENTLLIIENSGIDYETQVYAVASLLIGLVFVFCLISIGNGSYSFSAKLFISFAGLLLLFFALYGVYSTYSESEDVSVADDLSEGCYDLIDKVCGDDGVTYKNECEAQARGVAVQCSGNCPCDVSVSANAVCGNGVCDAGEDSFRKTNRYVSLYEGCPEDCVVCGDGICDPGEADVDTCDTGTSRWSKDERKYCEAVEGTCPDDCKTEPRGSAVCGPMDKNSDGKLNIVDFASFVKVYLKRCEINQELSASAKKEVCGFQDVNSDGVVNLVDFSSFVKRYGKDSCDL